MSLITNGFGTIITKGLGNGLCTLLTAQFGLACGCTIQIITPPGGGGGGYVIAPGFSVPFPSNLRKCDRIVLVTVRMGEDRVWRKQFIVDVCNTDRMVKVTNIINKIITKSQVQINNITRIRKSVRALFSNNK